MLPTGPALPPLSPPLKAPSVNVGGLHIVTILVLPLWHPPPPASPILGADPSEAHVPLDEAHVPLDDVGSPGRVSVRCQLCPGQLQLGWGASGYLVGQGCGASQVQREKE